MSDNQQHVDEILNYTCIETLQAIYDSDESPACRALASQQLMFLKKRELAMSGKGFVFSKIKWIVIPVVVLLLTFYAFGAMDEESYNYVKGMINGFELQEN